MKKFVIPVLSFLLCTKATSQDPESVQNLIGKSFNKVNEIEAFKNYKVYEGVVIDILKKENKGFLRITNRRKSFVIFDQYLPITKMYKILAILDIGIVNDFEKVVMRECRFNKKKDDFIIAILQPTISQLYFNKISKAWKLDVSKNNFISIKTNGINCLNEEFYND